MKKTRFRGSNLSDLQKVRAIVGSHPQAEKVKDIIYEIMLTYNPRERDEFLNSLDALGLWNHRILLLYNSCLENIWFTRNAVENLVTLKHALKITQDSIIKMTTQSEFDELVRMKNLTDSSAYWDFPDGRACY